MPIANIFGFSTRPRAGSRAKAPSAFKGNPNKPSSLTAKSSSSVFTPIATQPQSPVEEKAELETPNPPPIARVTSKRSVILSPVTPPPPGPAHTKSSPDLKAAKTKPVKNKKSTGSLASNANVSGSNISTASASSSTTPTPVEAPVHVRVKLPKGRVASYRYNIDYIMNGATVIAERTATGGNREDDSGERRSLHRSASSTFSSHSIESIETPSALTTHTHGHHGHHGTRHRNHVRSHMRSALEAPPSLHHTKSDSSLNNQFGSFGSLPPEPSSPESISSFQSTSSSSSAYTASTFDSESEAGESPMTSVGSLPSELDGVCSHYEYANAMATASANPTIDIRALPLLLTEPGARRIGAKETPKLTAVMNDAEASMLFNAAKEARAIERASLSLSISEAEHLARLEDARHRALRYKVVASILLARNAQGSARPITTRRSASTGQIHSSSRPRTAPAALGESEKETTIVLGGGCIKREYVRSTLGNMSTIAEV